MGEVEEKFKETLIPICSRHFGGSVTIEDLHRLSGGAVAESWWLDVICDAKRYELILTPKNFA